MFQRRSADNTNTSSWILLLIIAAASLIFYFLMSFYTSPHLDDLHYAYPYRHWLLGEGEFPGIEPWLRTIRAHFYGINGRLGDKLLIGYILMPKWLSASITSLSTVGFMLLAAYIATGNCRRHSLLSTALVVALILSLPWYDTMFLNCMAVNYIIAALLGMAALAIYFRAPEIIGRHPCMKCMTAFAIGFLAGSWHECFTFIFAPGLIAYPLFVRRINSMQRAVLTGGILGGIFILCNPGFWNRYDNQMHLMTMKNAVWVLYYANASLALFIAYPICLSIKRIRRRYTRQDLGIMTTCVIALALNILIFISNLSLPRVLWFGMAGGYIGLAVILRPFSPGKRLRLLSYIVVLGGVIFCLLHFIAAVVLQRKIDMEYKTVIGMYRKSEDGTVFYTEKASKEIEFLTLARPFYDQFQGWHTDAGTDTFYRKADELLQLVPVELRDFQPQKAMLLNKDEGIYLYKGLYVVDACVTPYKRYHHVFTKGKNNTRERILSVCHKFRTEDGRLWYYLQMPNREVLDSPRIQ